MGLQNRSSQPAAEVFIYSFFISGRYLGRCDPPSALAIAPPPALNRTPSFKMRPFQEQCYDPRSGGWRDGGVWVQPFSINGSRPMRASAWGRLAGRHRRCSLPETRENRKQGGRPVFVSYPDGPRTLLPRCNVRNGDRWYCGAAAAGEGADLSGVGARPRRAYPTSICGGFTRTISARRKPAPMAKVCPRRIRGFGRPCARSRRRSPATDPFRDHRSLPSGCSKSRRLRRQDYRPTAAASRSGGLLLDRGRAAAPDSKDPCLTCFSSRLRRRAPQNLNLAAWTQRPFCSGRSISVSEFRLQRGGPDDTPPFVERAIVATRVSYFAQRQLLLPQPAGPPSSNWWRESILVGHPATNMSATHDHVCGDECLSFFFRPGNWWEANRATVRRSGQIGQRAPAAARIDGAGRNWQQAAAVGPQRYRPRRGRTGIRPAVFVEVVSGRPHKPVATPVRDRRRAVETAPLDRWPIRTSRSIWEQAAGQARHQPVPFSLRAVLERGPWGSPPASNIWCASRLRHAARLFGRQ